jgi:hypothetical protein
VQPRGSGYVREDVCLGHLSSGVCTLQQCSMLLPKNCSTRDWCSAVQCSAVQCRQSTALSGLIHTCFLPSMDVQQPTSCCLRCLLLCKSYPTDPWSYLLIQVKLFSIQHIYEVWAECNAAPTALRNLPGTGGLVLAEYADSSVRLLNAMSAEVGSGVHGENGNINMVQALRQRGGAANMPETVQSRPSCQELCLTHKASPLSHHPVA